MKVIKYLLLTLVFFLFGLHLVQRVHPLFAQSSLIGVADTSKRPVFTFKSYTSGQFQQAFERFSEEKTGFHSTLVKLRNQIDYSVFNRSEEPWVIVGKDKMLFMETYIQNFKGSLFKGDIAIKNNVRRLKLIQDELKKHNVDFLLVFAPGKATFCSDLIPKNFKQRPVTNYKHYVQEISGSGLNFIDMNAWFLKMKGKTKMPLYPLNGSHWNAYGISLAADTMIRYIEKLRKIRLPEFWWDRATTTDSMRYDENDIGELMNLWWPLKQPAVPELHFNYREEGRTRPRVITIGDSYWLGFMKTGITAHVFERDYYWYYFRVVMDNGQITGFVANLDLKAQLYSHDLVILIVTESNYMSFPFGFIEGFFDKCLPGSAENFRIRQEQYIEKIKSDPVWFKYICQKAKESKRSIGEQLKLDARYMIEEEKNNSHGL